MIIGDDGGMILGFPRAGNTVIATYKDDWSYPVRTPEGGVEQTGFFMSDWTPPHSVQKRLRAGDWPTWAALIKDLDEEIRGLVAGEWD